MTASRLQIRRAGPADAAALQSLFALRSQTDEATAADAPLPDLDDPGRRVWLAFAGDRAVGMTGVEERRVCYAGKALQIAYWTGLFVDPSYRGQFVYPQLVLAMFAGLRGAGIRHIYGAIRRQQVAEAHMKMGFSKIGDMAVLAKPLRPALLLARYRRLLRTGADRPWLRLACGAADAVAGLLIRLQGPYPRLPAEEVPWNASSLADAASLCARSAAGLASQDWTADELRSRYAGDAAGYRLLMVREQGRPAAMAILRLVDRPEGIRAAVIMDFVHEPGARRAASSVLAAVERLALDAGCEVALFLDGIPPGELRMVRRRGFLKSPEKYVLLLWYDRGTDPGLLPGDIHSWRFTFGDHDTF